MADPRHPESDVRSRSYCIASAETRCRHCGRSSGVVALLVPEDHESLDAEITGELNAWQTAGANAFLFYVVDLPEGVQRRLLLLCPAFRWAHSEATLNSYWANHCAHCGSLLGDHDLHCEPGGAFMPQSEAEAACIRLLQIDEPLAAAAAGYAPEPEFFRFMRRV